MGVRKKTPVYRLACTVRCHLSCSVCDELILRLELQLQFNVLSAIHGIVN